MHKAHTKNLQCIIPKGYMELYNPDALSLDLSLLKECEAMFSSLEVCVHASVLVYIEYCIHIQ